MVFSLSNTFLLPFFYFNSSHLDNEENHQIKSLVLSALKERHSYMNSNDKIHYDGQHFDEIVQLYDQDAPKSMVCLLDYNFMSTVVQRDKTTYRVLVKMYYPETIYYEFEIKKINFEYVITFWGADI
jgi:hypothetical protein